MPQRAEALRRIAHLIRNKQRGARCRVKASRSRLHELEGMYAQHAARFAMLELGQVFLTQLELNRMRAVHIQIASATEEIQTATQLLLRRDRQMETVECRFREEESAGRRRAEKQDAAEWLEQKIGSSGSKR